MRINELHQVLPVLFKARITPLIIGHRGIGKSEAVKAYAEANDLDFYDMRVGTMSDSGDIVGLPFSISNEKGEKIATKFLTPSFMPRSGKGILFLDEVNRGTKEILQAVFQLILDGKVQEYVLPKGWNVVAAMNPPTEEYDVLDFNDLAFIDRFAQIKLENTVEDWIKWGRTKKLDKEILSWAAEHPEMINATLSEFPITAKPCFRGVTRFAKVKSLSKELGLNEGLIKELGHGMIGLEAVGSLYAHMENNKDKRLDVLAVLNDLKSYSDKIKEYSGVENNRNDILKVFLDDLQVHLEKTVLTPEQEVTFVDLCALLPKDLAVAFFSQAMITNAEVQKNFAKVHPSEDDSLFMLKSPNALKLKGLVEEWLHGKN